MLPDSLPRRVSSKEDLPLREESLPSKESVREDPPLREDSLPSKEVLPSSEDCPNSWV